jgi:hypothetical protein
MILEISKMTIFIVITLCTLFTMGCSCKPILYKPTADPSSIILSVNVPDTITSLSLFPRDRTIAEKGVNKSTGDRQPDEIEERFELFKASGPSTFLGAEYRIMLYRNEDAAKRGYGFQRRAALPIDFPPFREYSGEKLAYYFTHIRRPRSDVEGFCRPLSYYESQFIFRLRNLVVSIDTHHEDISSDLLVSSVKYFTEQLEKSIEAQKLKNKDD